MKKIYFPRFMTIVLAVGQIMLFSCLMSCSDDDDNTTTPTSPTDKTEIFVDRVTELLNNMTTLLDGAVFGEKAGEYPLKSRKILETQVVSLTETLTKLQEGTKKLSNSDMDNIIIETNKIITQFRASVRIEDFIAVSAELHVNGKNGGYIDFGRHPEYSTFSQGFTVDMWFKFEDI